MLRRYLYQTMKLHTTSATKMKKSKKPKKILDAFYSEGALEVGVDEAGRGPLLGPVYVGAAILPPEDFDHSLMRDSKKLSERKRMEAYDYIKENAIDWAVFSFNETQIDKKNIFNATYGAMHKALDRLQVRPDLILVDGCHFIPYHFEGRSVKHVCIEKGDDTYSAIAAASILAKVERDKYIKDLCNKYPNLDEYYGIAKNKGYGTAQHIEGIKKYGISKWHRKTFGICRNYA